MGFNIFLLFIDRKGRSLVSRISDKQKYKKNIPETSLLGSFSKKTPYFFYLLKEFVELIQ